jgi:hypothetical protein
VILDTLTNGDIGGIRYTQSKRCIDKTRGRDGLPIRMHDSLWRGDSNHVVGMHIVVGVVGMHIIVGYKPHIHGRKGVYPVQRHWHQTGNTHRHSAIAPWGAAPPE